MPLPPLIEQSQQKWLFKVTRELSAQPERDVCLLSFLFGTPATSLEINRIQLVDVLHKSGRLNKMFIIRGGSSFNGDDRPIYLKNKKLSDALEDYLQYRASRNICLGDEPDRYRGLDPDDYLFITNKGAGFSVLKKETQKGNPSYSCDALNRHLKLLMKKSGIENPSILSGRRTFAVNLRRKGYDVAHIHHLLGNKSLETTTKLLTTDPVDMGEIAAQAF